MPGNIGEQERKKLISYVLLAAGLFVLFYLSRSSDWKGAKDLHTLMEVIATVVALSVGVLGLVRYRSQPNNTILIISAAFLGTALLDGYHALVTSRWFDIYWRSPPPQLIPWSWNASRTFLAMMLVLSWLAWRREKRLGVSGTISPLPVFTTVGVLTVASFVFFAFTPLPPPITRINSSGVLRNWFPQACSCWRLLAI